MALTINSAAFSSAATSSPAGRAVNGARATTVADLASGSIDDDDRRGAGVVEGGDDAARCRSGTDHGDVHPTHVDAVGVEGGDEALPVGAVADQPAVRPRRRRC